MNTKGLTIIALVAVYLGVAGQKMEPRSYNFERFTKEVKTITPTLIKNTPEQYQKHPEFGVVAYHTQCDHCVELLQKRTYDSRYYIDPDDASRFYVQKSYTPLHYKDQQGIFRTIDPRLKPDADNDDIYWAEDQPVPTKYDFGKKAAAIEVSGQEFTFNGNLSLNYLDQNDQQTFLGKANYDNATIGEDGVFTKDAWKNIDIQQIYNTAGVKTNYIINEPLALPDDEGWLVIQDEIELPDGYQFVSKGKENALHEIAIADDNDRLVVFSRPKYHDGYGWGMSGSYQLDRKDEAYSLKIMIPVSWLNAEDVTYPLYIDPWVYGRDSIGFFGYVSSGGFPVNGGGTLGFTQNTLGSCDTTMMVTVPGKSELFDAWIDLEYTISDSSCVPAVPPASPYCEFFDVTMEVVGPCGSTGQLACNPALPPFLGTCTTDPNKVPGASAVYLQNFAHCVPPQCPDYILPFTLKNRSYQCLETCGHNCAIGRFFAVTVGGRTIENTVTAFPDTVCAGQEVALTAYPDYGVPPYTYLWMPSGLTDSIVIVKPETTTTYIGTAFDTCGNSAADNVMVVVKPTPDADAGDDQTACAGDAFNIGGNPTGPASASFTWTSDPLSATSLLNTSTGPNPFLSVPQGTNDTFVYIVRVEDALCFRLDTIVVEAVPNLQPVLDVDTVSAICDGDQLTIATVQNYDQYLWSTGTTSATITVSESGNYTVTVTDANGCTGVSNTSQLVIIPSLAVTISPDTSFELGGSATLFADIDLNGSSVMDYMWGPNMDISCLNCENPVVSPGETRDYYLSVVSSDSCLSSDTLTIKIILPNKYVIPTAFSPNNDGVNDRFRVLGGSGVTVKEQKIFNRWGQIVHDAPTPWDGIFQDEPQPIGVYSYLITLELFDVGEVTESGSVTLIR